MIAWLNLMAEAVQLLACLGVSAFTLGYVGRREWPHILETWRRLRAAQTAERAKRLEQAHRRLVKLETMNLTWAIASHGFAVWSCSECGIEFVTQTPERLCPSCAPGRAIEVA